MIDLEAAAKPVAPPFSLSRQVLAGLARGAVLALALWAGGSGLNYVLHILLARWMGTADFGAYVYATTWATLLALFGGLGLNNAAIRFIPIYRSTSDFGRLAGIIARGRVLTLVGSVGFAAAGSALALALGSDRLVAGLVPTLLGLWLIPSFAIMEFEASVARCDRRVGVAYGPPFLLRPVIVILTVAAIFALDAPRTASTALAATLVVALAITALQRRLVDRGLSGELRRIARVYETPTWLKVALPLLVFGGLQLVLTQTDVLIVGALGGREDAALYSAAAKTALLVSYFLIAMNIVAAPLFAPLDVSGDRAQLQRLVATTAQWVFWPSLCLAALLAVLAPHILALFGPDFADARWPLTILLLGQLTVAAFGTAGNLLAFTGHQRALVRAQVVVVATNVVMCLVGTYAFGMIGAAVATAISSVTMTLWMYRVSLRRLGIDASVLARIRRRPLKGGESG